MRLFSCPLLADENIHPRVLTELRAKGCAVDDVLSRGLSRQNDQYLLDLALREGRIVVTHDRDFGQLAIHRKQPIYGIVFLRPGHIDARYTLDSLEAIDRHDLDLTPSFILVAKRRGPQVQLRLRRW